MKNDTEKTAQLIVSLKNGETWAFREIFETYQTRLYHFVFSITKSNFATEDILQEVFLKIWIKKAGINVSRSFDSYIYTIAKNHTYNYLRRVSNQESLRKEVWRNLKYYNRQTENTLLLAEYENIVDDILENLPVKKRSIFILSKQQGKSNQEIANLLNISTKTVKNHLWKASKLIRLQLQPYISDTIIALLLLPSFL
ncbi:MAG: RNA polymerase sigma-70 factor [Flavobacteriaceae bacterium]